MGRNPWHVVTTSSSAGSGSAGDCASTAAPRSARQYELLGSRSVGERAHTGPRGVGRDARVHAELASATPGSGVLFATRSWPPRSRSTLRAG